MSQATKDQNVRVNNSSFHNAQKCLVRCYPCRAMNADNVFHHSDTGEIVTVRVACSRASRLIVSYLYTWRLSPKWHVASLFILFRGLCFVCTVVTALRILSHCLLLLTAVHGPVYK